MSATPRNIRNTLTMSEAELRSATMLIGSLPERDADHFRFSQSAMLLHTGLRMRSCQGPGC